MGGGVQLEAVTVEKPGDAVGREGCQEAGVK